MHYSKSSGSKKDFWSAYQDHKQRERKKYLKGYRNGNDFTLDITHKTPVSTHHIVIRALHKATKSYIERNNKNHNYLCCKIKLNSIKWKKVTRKHPPHNNAFTNGQIPDHKQRRNGLFFFFFPFNTVCCALHRNTNYLYSFFLLFDTPGNLTGLESLLLYGLAVKLC